MTILSKRKTTSQKGLKMTSQLRERGGKLHIWKSQTRKHKHWFESIELQRTQKKVNEITRMLAEYQFFLDVHDYSHKILQLTTSISCVSTAPKGTVGGVRWDGRARTPDRAFPDRCHFIIRGCHLRWRSLGREADWSCCFQKMCGNESGQEDV